MDGNMVTNSNQHRINLSSAGAEKLGREAFGKEIISEGVRELALCEAMAEEGNVIAAELYRLIIFYGSFMNAVNIYYRHFEVYYYVLLAQERKILGFVQQRVELF